jgi:hypothetical protein
MTASCILLALGVAVACVMATVAALCMVQINRDDSDS